MQRRSCIYTNAFSLNLLRTWTFKNVHVRTKYKICTILYLNLHYLFTLTKISQLQVSRLSYCRLRDVVYIELYRSVPSYCDGWWDNCDIHEKSRKVIVMIFSVIKNVKSLDWSKSEIGPSSRFHEISFHLISTFFANFLINWITSFALPILCPSAENAAKNIGQIGS